MALCYLLSRPWISSTTKRQDGLVGVELLVAGNHDSELVEELSGDREHVG